VRKKANVAKNRKRGLMVPKIGLSGSFERFFQDQKGVKRHNFISFENIYFLSLAQKNGYSPYPFTEDFPKKSQPFCPKLKKFTPVAQV
jgi:hypothetical protein